MLWRRKSWKDVLTESTTNNCWQQLFGPVLPTIQFFDSTFYSWMLENEELHIVYSGYVFIFRAAHIVE